MKAPAAILTGFAGRSKELAARKVLSADAAGCDAPVFQISGRTEMIRFASSPAREALEKYMASGGTFPAELYLQCRSNSEVCKQHSFEERTMNGTSKFLWLAFTVEGRRVDSFDSIHFEPIPPYGPQPD